MSDQRQVTRQAFAAMARENEAALIQTARRLCRGDQDRAQDLVQDALVRAYQACLEGRYDGSRNARPWLTRILTNLFINDHLQRRRRGTDIDLDALTSLGEAGPAQTHAAPDDVPGVALLAHTLDEELEQALGMLSDGLKQCILLVDVQGLEYEEAASALGVPIGTVRSRLARARMKLHDLLQAFGKSRGYTQ